MWYIDHGIDGAAFSDICRAGPTTRGSIGVQGGACRVEVDRLRKETIAHLQDLEKLLFVKMLSWKCYSSMPKAGLLALKKGKTVVSNKHAATNKAVNEIGLRTKIMKSPCDIMRD